MDDRKTVVVTYPGAGEGLEGRDAMIEPETTAADLLEALGRDPSDWGFLVEGDGRRVSLSGQDRPFDMVAEGQKLHVTSVRMMGVAG